MVGLALQERSPPRSPLTLSDYPAIAARKRSDLAYLRPAVQLIQHSRIFKTGAELSKLISAGDDPDINVPGKERAGKDNPITALVYVPWIRPTGPQRRGRTGRFWSCR